MRLGYIFPSEQKVESPEANPCSLLPFYNKDATLVSQLFNLHLQDIFTPIKKIQNNRIKQIIHSPNQAQEFLGIFVEANFSSIYSWLQKSHKVANLCLLLLKMNHIRHVSMMTVFIMLI